LFQVVFQRTLFVFPQLTSSTSGMFLILLLGCLCRGIEATSCSNGASPTVTTVSISNYNDDVEADVDNDTYLYAISSDIELGYDNDASSSVSNSGATRFEGKQYSFLRFTGVNVPANNVVQSAKIVFHVKKHGSCCNDLFSVTVKMLKSANAPAFTTPGLGSVWSSSSTTASLTYQPPVDTNSSGGSYPGAGSVTRDSPDLKNLVQEVVDMSGWESGNAMAVLFGDATSTSESQSREYWAYSRRRSSGPPVEYAPKLEVTHCPNNRVATTSGAFFQDGKCLLLTCLHIFVLLGVDWMGSGAL